MLLLNSPVSPDRRIVDAVSFDLWETLIHLKDAKEQRILFLAELLRRSAQPRQMEDLRQAYAFGQRQFQKEWYESRSYFGAEAWIGLMLRELDATLPETDFHTCVCHFQQVILQDPPPLLEGAAHLVSWLSVRIPVVLVSDSGLTPGATLRDILKIHGLLHHFSATVFSDETGFTKPDPRMFHLALQGTGVPPQRTLHVGDNPKTDVAGAVSAGLGAIWLDRENKGLPGTGPLPLWRIESLQDLQEALSEATR